MKEIDCLGMRCPLPIIEVGMLMKEAAIGESMILHSDDPATEIDLTAWGRMTGNKVEAIGTHQYLITKSEVH